MSLPKPNVNFRTSDDEREYTAEDIRGILTNPVHAGVGRYPEALAVSDKKWVRTNIELLKMLGSEQYLVNLLYLLRKTFGYYGGGGEGEEQALVNFIFPYITETPEWKRRGKKNE